MDDWVKAGGAGDWSRRRFLLQTAKFSALALLGSPITLLHGLGAGSAVAA
jgi:tartrate-resistant acid phosphatase type 5